MSAVDSYIGLGSNLGDARVQFERAYSALNDFCRITASSSLYRSTPYGFSGQEDFTNAVLRVRTELPARALLDRMQAVERSLGKKVIRPHGPRNIDLDLLFHGSEVASEPGMEIPHPGIADRDFVLLPMMELDPLLVHPVLGKTIRELHAELKERHVKGEPEPWDPC